MSFSLVIKDFIQFLKRPHLQGLKLSKGDKIKNTFKLWGLSLVTIVVLSQLIDTVLDVPEPDMFDVIMKQMGLPVFVIFVVLIGPLIEEVAFRLPMRFRISYLLGAFVLLAFYMVAIFEKAGGNTVFIVLGILVVSFIALVYFLSQKLEKSKKVYERYYPYVFYLLTILFGYIHITNFEVITTKVLLLSPIIVFPQFALGLGMGYIRVRYGFWYSCLFHIMNNALATTFLLLSKFVYPDVF